MPSLEPPGQAAASALARLVTRVGALPAASDRAADTLKRMAGMVRDLSGWRRCAVACAAGILSVLAMAPFFIWPVLFLTFPVLIWLIDGAVIGAARRDRPGARGRFGRWIPADTLTAAGVGWWFGFGYFAVGLFWVGEAFLVEAETFAVLLPFAVTLLPAGLALFYGAAAAIAVPFWRTGAYRVLSLALALSALEYARGHVLTGFPWNVLGYALTSPLSLMQSASVFGIYGLTLITVAALAAPLVLIADAPLGIEGRRWRRRVLAGALVFLLAATVWGHLRLALAPVDFVAGVKIRIVQPSVAQREKWRPENQERIFLDHLALSATGASGAADGLAGITHVIWPEAAMPFLPLNHPAARAAIGRMLPPGTLLITGALRAEEAVANPLRGRRIFNSMLVFGEAGSLVAHYDKIHLVPFGEYLPFQTWLEAIGLQQLTRLRGGFEAGSEPRPLLHLPGMSGVAPLICYEAIFPGEIVQAAARPALLLNVTNDGWFGNTIGPRQHLQQARVRAVEQGVPLARAANNGISAMIDGHGRVLARLDLDQRGSVDAGLPRALSPTLYARYGDWSFVLLWVIGAVLIGLKMGQRTSRQG